jgi:hypothetical protein
MITLVFTGDMSPARRAVFERAALRWDQVIDSTFDPVDVDGEVLSNLTIDASIKPIDGPAGVLGQAGPTVLRGDNGLPIKGIMQFDDADIARLEQEDSFADVILHEMAHVLGFGTLWPRNDLIVGTGTNDPRFNGPAAAREFAALVPDDGPLVPIANTGGAGTREGHWRELVFGDELLTGFLSGSDRPLSRMSIASFEDLGYAVDYTAADPFVLPTFQQLALMGITEAVRICDLCRVDRPEPIVIDC